MQALTRAHQRSPGERSPFDEILSSQVLTFVEPGGGGPQR
jgi:hypothetical protein